MFQLLREQNGVLRTLKREGLTLMAITKLQALLALIPAALLANSAHAQSRADGEACLQAKQAEGDALNANDWLHWRPWRKC